jgi:hypothetical protein
MSRSHYIYVVTADEQRDPKAAFTVKHECVSYLRRQLAGYIDDMHVQLFKGGTHTETVWAPKWLEGIK